MNAINLFFSSNFVTKESIANKKIRKIEASLLTETMLFRIALLEGFYVNGVKCSLSEN
jgi:hypothetical protein